MSVAGRDDLLLTQQFPRARSPEQRRPLIRPHLHPRSCTSRLRVRLSPAVCPAFCVLTGLLGTCSAQVAGWPCIILSDTFALRGYSDLAFSKPKVPRPPKDAAAAPAAADPAVAAAAAGGGQPVPQERAEGIVRRAFSPLPQRVTDPVGNYRRTSSSLSSCSCSK